MKFVYILTVETHSDNVIIYKRFVTKDFIKGMKQIDVGEHPTPDQAPWAAWVATHEQTRPSLF